VGYGYEVGRGLDGGDWFDLGLVDGGSWVGGCGSAMRGLIFAAAWILTMVVIGTCVNLTTGCAGDGKRERWQDCGGVHHRVCEGDLACEYEFYKECIND